MIRLTRGSAALLGVGLLLASYVLYARDSTRVATVLATPVALRRPLRDLPLRLGDWLGKDVPLDAQVVKGAGADDYVSRDYHNVMSGEALSLYLSYYGRPRATVGHYPDRCFPAFGWSRELVQTVRIPGSGMMGNIAWPAAVYRFRKGGRQTTVVNSFKAGGSYTADRDDVVPMVHQKINSENKNYLVQLQISFQGSPRVGQTLRVTGRFLSELLPKLENHLPSSAAADASAPPSQE